MISSSANVHFFAATNSKKWNIDPGRHRKHCSKVTGELAHFAVRHVVQLQPLHWEALNTQEVLQHLQCIEMQKWEKGKGFTRNGKYVDSWVGRLKDWGRKCPLALLCERMPSLLIHRVAGKLLEHQLGRLPMCAIWNMPYVTMLQICMLHAVQNHHRLLTMKFKIAIQLHPIQLRLECKSWTHESTHECDGYILKTTRLRQRLNSLRVLPHHLKGTSRQNRRSWRRWSGRKGGHLAQCGGVPPILVAIKHMNHEDAICTLIMCDAVRETCVGSVTDWQTWQQLSATIMVTFTTSCVLDW